ncbi:MAG TPA: hypothetical protein VGC27_02465 [Rhizomicrobium sp.]
MNLRIIAMGFAAFLLCGCTEADLDYATLYVVPGQAKESEPPQAAQIESSELPPARRTENSAPPAAPTNNSESPLVVQTENREPPRAVPTENREPPAAPARTQAAPAPIPAEQAAEPDSWCQQIAKSSANEAARNGYDSSTQQRRAEKTYRQCVGSSGR